MKQEGHIAVPFLVELVVVVAEVLDLAFKLSEVLGIYLPKMVDISYLVIGLICAIGLHDVAW